MLLQVLDLQKSKAIEARDEAIEQLRVAASERDEAMQQLADLRSAHEAALEAASAHAAARDKARYEIDMPVTSPCPVMKFQPYIAATSLKPTPGA